MSDSSFIKFMSTICLFVLLLPETCIASIQSVGQINPGFQATQMKFIDNDGIFLISNNSKFGFGFTPTKDVTTFLLTVVYLRSTMIVWSANRDSLVQNFDAFKFDKSGNAFLEGAGSVVWETGTTNKGISAMELHDSGNLVMLDDEKKVIWQSFTHPTDTLLPDQDFVESMKLISGANPKSNVSYFLEIKSGDMILYAGYETPQPYWSMSKDRRKIINEDGAGVSTAVINGNSWRFSDRSKVLLWQFIIQENGDGNDTWTAVLDNNGFITFKDLETGGSPSSQMTIPTGSCSTPDYCDDAYFLCSGNQCRCPSALASRSCKTGISSPCADHPSATELVSTGDGVGYAALPFVQPTSKSDLEGCKSSCLSNCSCAALFFESSSGHCFMFDRVGSLQSSAENSGLVSFIKVSSISGNGTDTDGNGSGTNKRFLIVMVITVFTVVVILGLLYGGYRYHRKHRREEAEWPQEEEASEEDNNFSETMSGMPIRFHYKDLQTATNNFAVKLGQGGFGSVYQGTLPDGTRIAVKKLEGVGQGKKEFKAEVNIIGCIHHLHLVRLRGFCTGGAHRLLAYEYMGNGSLEKWIFKNNKGGGFMLDWDTRYNIAVGTAKGLAYLHEDCDVKIVHCDIKPENVLLDDNFHAKVSDFGLAKLMTREQSHVFTTMRGTRGYLAPEWITNYAISEKSDVYSYGMVLLEIIGGRKNYDPSESSEKAHFPSYAFKMLEDGKLKEILDSKLKIDDQDERWEIAVKVALWCIQEDMSQRPSMTRVVQMLEGLSIVPTPPTSSHMGARLYATYFKSISEEGGTSSGPSDCNSDAHLSAVRLSGPR